MSLKVYNYDCPEHGIFSETVDFEFRNEKQPCPECEVYSERTWMGAGPVVLKASYLDGNRRFDGVRQDMKAKRALAEAKANSDMDGVKEARKELKERKAKK